MMSPRRLWLPVALLFWCTDLVALPALQESRGELHGPELESLPAPTPADPQPGPRDSFSGAGLSDSDSQGLRAAYESARHAVTTVSDGYRARGPYQRWSCRFDGRGVLVEPDEGEWNWGLQLEGYGFSADGTFSAERMVEVHDPDDVSVEAAQVIYHWDATLDEWYKNGPNGLEHGFTVYRDPDQDSANPGEVLRLALGVCGDLRAVIEGDGLGARFVSESGAAVLSYTGLYVLDADGRELPARLKPLGEGLAIEVDTRYAHFPLSIDPTASALYVKASNPDAVDGFGYAVAVSGDYAVVGALAESSNATGVNGDQSDNSAAASGAAYVFVRQGSGWSQQAYLKASNTGPNDAFGVSVAISGDTVVVGAYYESSGGPGVGANQNNELAPNSGAAYVFVRNGSTWTQQAFLKSSNTEISDQFGLSVAISGDTIVVGAANEDSAFSGVNGNQLDNSLAYSGAAYVFVRTGTTWSQQAYLKASNPDSSDWFGLPVAVSGDTVVVGAKGESSSATGINGDQGDNSMSSSGAAYVFVRSGTTWSQQAYLKASNTGLADGFGMSLALWGDTLVVGAPWESSLATGVGADQSDNGAWGTGAVYVFVRRGSTWSQEEYIKASNAGANDRFGASVALHENLMLVGAFWEDSSAQGVNGDPFNDAAYSSGAAYLFQRESTGWTQISYIKSSNTEIQDWFGWAVALSGSDALMGAPSESGGSSGVGGDQSDNSLWHAGAAYIYSVPSLFPWSEFCTGDGSGAACPCGNPGGPGEGCANSTGGGASLTASGSATVSDDSLVLLAGGTPPGQPGLFFQGDNATNSGLGMLFGDGLRCAGGSIVRLQVVAADGAGSSSSTLSLSTRGGVIGGDTKRYQWWYRDPFGSPCGGGFNLSNGLEVTWGM